MAGENGLTRIACAHNKIELPVKSAVTVEFPIDTIANARAVLERVVIVATAVLSTLDAGVAKYGDAEVLRGIAQLLSTF